MSKSVRSCPPFHFTTHLLLVHFPSVMRCCGDFLGSTAIRLPLSPSAPTTRNPGADVPPPANLPPQTPLLLVPFVNLVGIKHVSLTLWDSSSSATRLK